MFEVWQKRLSRGRAVVALVLVLALPMALFADKKKDKKKTTAPPPEPVKIPDFRSLVVFPSPPAIARVRYMDYFSAEKAPPQEKKQKKKLSWMDRMAGTSVEVDRNNGQKPRFQLLAPYGVAVDSKGRLYVADSRVGAVFIFNTETGDVELIKHGLDAKFGTILGLAIDDNDNLFVSDGELRHVLMFDANHKVQARFGDGVLVDPNGLAIDTENRFLYVADTELDQVLVFDADTYKLLRRIGTAGKAHTLTDPGNFSKPTNVAVDKDGNLYVSDTWNDRVEVFDADGEFIRTWGKNGDGPGDFARPKGIAIDSDGHVWVADAMLNRLQIFTSQGRLLLAMGSFGILPGQFEALTGLCIDTKRNLVFTAEQLLGRTQMFRYITNAEAKAEFERRQAELEKKAEERRSGTKPADAAGSAETTGTPQTSSTPNANAPSGSAPAGSTPSGNAPPATLPANQAPSPGQVMKQQQSQPSAQPDKSPPPTPPNH